jgi:hypothetical protein
MYATLADVLDVAPKLVIGPATKPSVEDAQAIIDAVNQHVNSVVSGLGYLTPVSKVDCPQSYVILRDIVCQGALAKILRAMFYGIRDPDEVGANDAYREFMAQMKALTDPENPFTLPDATANQQVIKVSSELESTALDPAEVDNMWIPRMTRLQEF